MKQYEMKDGRQVVIREAVAADAARLLEYLRQVTAETDYLIFGEGEVNPSVRREAAMVEEGSRIDNQLFLVAEVEGEIIGELNFIGGDKPRISHTGEFGVNVAQEYWGQGVGSYLISYLLEWSRASGVIRKINLRVRSDNQPAIAMYENFGFIIEGVISRDFRIDGEFYDSVFMGLQID